MPFIMHQFWICMSICHDCSSLILNVQCLSCRKCMQVPLIDMASMLQGQIRILLGFFNQASNHVNLTMCVWKPVYRLQKSTYGYIYIIVMTLELTQLLFSLQYNGNPPYRDSKFTPAPSSPCYLHPVDSTFVGFDYNNILQTTQGTHIETSQSTEKPR